MANVGKITQVIGPVVDVCFDEETAKLPNILDALVVTKDNGVEGLSMGMSGDYETAVQLGATHVRVGTALFGARGG